MLEFRGEFGNGKRHLTWSFKASGIVIGIAAIVIVAMLADDSNQVISWIVTLIMGRSQ